PRGVPRTLAHRPDTRAPEVFGAPRVSSASPLRVFLYAFWSRRSRLASARGGAHIDILYSVVEPPILCVRRLEGWHPKAPHPISVPKSVTPRGAQGAPVTPPAPPPSLRHCPPWLDAGTPSPSGGCGRQGPGRRTHPPPQSRGSPGRRPAARWTR